jgi:hypothetical protein
VRRASWVLVAAVASSCGSLVPPAPAPLAQPPAQPPVHAPAGGIDFVISLVRPWPRPDASTGFVVVAPGERRVAIYDNALASILLDAAGRHEQAGRILEALALLQRDDGSLPFSFSIDRAEDAPRYVRSGALAWVGYAAVEYLNSAAGGPGRAAIVTMAHRIASYLESRRVARPGDPRRGLVTGGEGNLVYDVTDGGVAEDFAPAAVDWVSVEHNIDAFFFLRDLGRLTRRPAYSDAADDIARALIARAWDPGAGQFRRGVVARGLDPALPLDCASWGSLFLVAAGEPERAEAALATADERFASRDPATGIAGHRPYAAGPLFEDAAVAKHYAARGATTDWARAPSVWPEGSAGVALAALRLGHRERAAAILEELERLRDASGGIPMMTADVPYEFDRKPSVAAVAWVELVRRELGASDGAPLLWRP